MSGNDPFDPFGQNERTIIRPNPGGRAPQQPGGAAPQQPQPPQQPPQQPAAVGYQPPHAQSVTLSMPGANPLLSAAGPLLDLLGRLRNAMTMATFTDLKTSIARAIDSFEAEATRRGAEQAHLMIAKYALCATADDIVQNLPGEDRHVYTADPMTGRYFGDRLGGTRFYENLQKLLQNPGANYDLLELKYACMALGFEGMHRTSQQGIVGVQKIMREVHQAMRAVMPGAGWAISPRWQGMDLGRRSIGMQIPFWAVLALALLLLAGLFFVLRMLLADQTTALATEVRGLHPTNDIQIAREAYAREAPPPPPPPPPAAVVDHGQLERIQKALASEIAAGKLEARYLDANYIIVRLPNELLFASGKADVTSAFKTGLAPRIGEMFKAETALLSKKGFQHGRVIAIGHSDAQPLGATSRWASNYELSKARAKSVMDAILAYAPDGLRTLADGRGADDPVCTPAEDPGCWPRNRRVELLIERTN
jgi:type VI secretion system protein ImpK